MYEVPSHASDLLTPSHSSRASQSEPRSVPRPYVSLVPLPRGEQVVGRLPYLIDLSKRLRDDLESDSQKRRPCFSNGRSSSETGSRMQID